jgi:hypothetical protein
MATSSGESRKWAKIGELTSTPSGGEKGKEVKIDDYYVVVGFEVNNPAAFVNDTQDLAIDYGHAFFYVVKNLLIEKVFSFGPKDGGKVGWFNQGNSRNPNWANTGAILKDGYQNARPGTPDYRVDEKVSAFKMPLTGSLGVRLVRETESQRQKVIGGKQRYTAYMSDTCAEEARDVLSDAGVGCPEGSGIVRHSGMGVATGTYVDTRLGRYLVGFTAVNPYMWHKNFKASVYASNEYTPPPSWLPPVGAADPIF